MCLLYTFYVSVISDRTHEDIVNSSIPDAMLLCIAREASETRSVTPTDTAGKSRD